jgi:hypothetical protein
MTTVDSTIELFCRVDAQMLDTKKHSQAKRGIQHALDRRSQAVLASEPMGLDWPVICMEKPISI